MQPTRAVDVVLGTFALLAPEEQEELAERLAAACLARRAGSESEGERMLRSLRRVADQLGHTPTAEEYRNVRAALSSREGELASLAQLLRHFGSWRRAKEALSLSETSSARMIEERFRKRRIGRPRSFSLAELHDALARCSAEYGRPPLLAEYEHWRSRELELARASGDTNFHLPSAAPYRRRWGSWENGLRSLGYAQTEIDRRLDES